jgi:hypothetical protein
MFILKQINPLSKVNSQTAEFVLNSRKFWNKLASLLRCCAPSGGALGHKLKI